MTAYRLAEHVAHTTDVDGMLDQMTPQQFTYWQAKDMIEPIGSRAVASILSKIGQLVAGLCGHKLEDIHFRPWEKTPEDKPLTAAESARAITTVFGGLRRG